MSEKLKPPPIAEDGISKEALLAAGIYKRYQDVSFKKLEGIDGIIRDNAKLVWRYAQDIEKHIKNGNGLILSGTCGTMKTTLAVCVLKTYLAKGGRGLFIPMCSLMDNLYTMKARNIDEWLRFELRVRETPLLVIDDLGSENTSAEWVAAKVNSIITERYNQKKTVIVTTNLTQDELKDTYQGRIIDRLRQTNYFLQFTAKSKRKELSLTDLQ